MSILCAALSNQQTDDPPCFPNCSVLSVYSVFMTRIIMGSQWLHGTCHTKFWNRTRNWLFLLMWSTSCSHEAEMTDRLPVAQCQYPTSSLSFDIARKEPEEILNISSWRTCQDEANFRRITELWLLTKAASYKATIVPLLHPAVPAQCQGT